MKQESADIVLKVLSEWNQYEVRMNYDTECTEIIRNFINILRSLTFASTSIMRSLREVADEIEDEMEIYNKEKNEDLEYGSAD
jgi:hypothetical protein